MRQCRITYFAIAALLLASAGPSSAQSIGYSQALGELGASCGKDIEKFCKTTNLGGGRMTQCLEQTGQHFGELQGERHRDGGVAGDTGAGTRRVMRICDADIRRFCPAWRRATAT